MESFKGSIAKTINGAPMGKLRCCLMYPLSRVLFYRTTAKLSMVTCYEEDYSVGSQVH